MKNRALFALLSGLLLLVAQAFAQQFNYVSIDVNCDADTNPTECPAGLAPGGTALGTWASGIAPGGQIVGGYIGQADGKEHGYLYSNGAFTTIDVPGSLVGLPSDVRLETEVNGINPAGDMVGDYFALPGSPEAPACIAAHSPPCDRGFLYRHGQFSSVLVPSHLGSVPSSISPGGAIYGCLHDQTFGIEMFGFVRTQSGSYKTFSYKTLQTGGGELADTNQSVSPSMNNGATPDGSTIVGLYVPTGSSFPHGYKVQNGVFNDYVFPGSLATQIWGINPSGDFVGFYRDKPGPTGLHGFLQPADGAVPMALNYPQAMRTEALGINPGGAIVGLYVDSDGGTHGFLAAPISTD